MIEVATVFAPRPQHPKWREYLPLIELQRQTAKHWGCRHTVVTDAHLGFDALTVDLPESLMRAQLAGQIAFLEQWAGDNHLLLLDADCLITHDPKEAFDGKFDLGLTWRDNPNCMINNGAMYVSAGAKERALGFFRHALTLCKDHWGGDQEAISQAAAPVPMVNDQQGMRHGALVRFLSMRDYASVPMREGIASTKKTPFVVHFKGEHRKEWMATYVRKFILTGE